MLNFPPAGESRKNNTGRKREEGTAENKGGGGKSERTGDLVERLWGRVGKREEVAQVETCRVSVEVPAV